jgi:hypothetical protein
VERQNSGNFESNTHKIDNGNNINNENNLNANNDVFDNNVPGEEKIDASQLQNSRDAWGSDVDNLNSKSDTEILPSKHSRKHTKRYVPGESMTKKNKSNQQKLANLVNIIDDEPETYEEAINSQFNLKWKEAIKSEVDALIENKTWTDMPLPESKKIIKTRWVFKLKKDSNNIPVRFKAYKTIINNSISVVHVPTEQNIADVLTKGLDKLKHYKLIEMMGLKKIGKMFTSDYSVSLVTKNKSDTSVGQTSYHFCNLN